ncbi:L-threonylcarbamoyladenylate synthase [Synechococcus sp. R55.3]|jgi:tRNA threonylcarbamoyl adenosine modification protein (Sua5/YciO/YrdC/YwlC family)|uniref:L-threonylcarbamoyladenylate synthase n=1 Tax=unclassified Synechococcus TaxID=2626047 RepID=UPI0039C20420
MAEYFKLHPQQPQTRSIRRIAAALREGAVMLYPTDTVYAIGCDATHKQAVERVRRIKHLSNDKPLTFLCPSLSRIAQYAQVTDSAYRLMRRLIPGPFTFLLPATKLVPKLVMDPKRKTTGIRVPDSAICQALLEELGNPIVSTSAKLGGDPVGSLGLSFGQTWEWESDPWDEGGIFAAEEMRQLEKQVDLVLDDDAPRRAKVSTVIDLTGSEPLVVRAGLGYEQVADLNLKLVGEDG